MNCMLVLTAGCCTLTGPTSRISVCGVSCSQIMFGAVHRSCRRSLQLTVLRVELKLKPGWRRGDRSQSQGQGHGQGQGQGKG